MSEILTIWAKEMRDTIRDRRTLLVMVLIPILLTPALLVGMNALAKSTATATLRVAVAGGSGAPQVVRLLTAQPHLALTTRPDPAAAVKDGAADAGLIIAPDFTARIAAGGSGHVTIVSDSTQLQSTRAIAAISTALEAFSGRVVTQRLAAHGLPPSVLSPVEQASQDTATKQALAGFVLSLIVPMFLVMYSMSGGMYTAMDVSAGEKERFTMEALLLTPATKLQITLGKLLAVSTVAVASVVIALVALFVALLRFPLTETGTETTLTLGVAALAQIAVLGILLAVSFAALELALGVFARSFKEAQNYITPLYLIALLPVVAIGVIPGFKPGLAFYLIPALNAVLVFKEALLGSGEVLHVVLSVATMLLFCAACIGVTLRIFSNERVLLRS